MTRRGFTFIEAIVSIGVVSVMAAIIFPNVVRESTVRKDRLFRKTIVAYEVQTRNRAIETRRTVSLSYNKDDKTIEAIEEDQNGVSKPFPALQLPETIKITDLLADKEESPPDGWRVPFFADGTTTGGGIEFHKGDEVFSLVIDRYSAKAQIIPDKLPDFAQQTWPAGGVQKRG